ncbi:hypothetical protein MCHIJ_20410 [Mycolicibacterium chitae]|uniref:CAP domain-containing protein n=1 Tax=Mycolicibacterium chitae TaxID=1792 RepID=A0A448HYY4_MYCCI|nr:hypothetical protein [Mycolicibacterium chitae]MCV7107130.1 hypothetical protein [Mycolicibacterium chitae]BBZ02604.1 hypothetical protein MCHIJ_20410 [Mycolicibacterium chitae]VEG45324.1 Uncharacterised protein [Mycolicibacterium chitae]
MSVNEAGTPRRVGVVLAGLLGAGSFWATPAAAEARAQFDAGIAAVRAASTCPALAHDPLAQRAAELSNRSTEDYLNHTAEHVPVADPLFVLHDLGSDAQRAVQLQGQGPTLAEALKGALLQGNSTIPDCAYTGFGTSVIEHAASGHTLVVAVLTG